MSIRRRALVSALFSSAIAVGALVSTGTDAGALELSPPSSTPRAESANDDGTPVDPDEDSPLFDCRVHGNRVCGPGALVPVPIAPGVVVLVPVDTAPLVCRP